MDFDYRLIIQHYPLLLYGLGMTLAVTVLAVVGGTAIGLLFCGASLSDRWVMQRGARAYINFFRTTPEMVLIFWIYFCLPPLVDIRLSAFWSGTLALTLVTGAYLSEIFRAGIESLPSGQFAAARALGLRTIHQWRLVILPQAVRRMIPAFMAYLTELLKNTALLSAIGVGELAYQANTLGAETFRYLEFLSAVAVMFFVVIYPISLVVRRAEWRTGGPSS